MKSAIRLENISFGYTKDKPIFTNLNLEIGVGEFVAIIGHNGSGKSTLAKIITGLNPILEGKIFIFDQELTRENSYEVRKDVGIVFQNPDNQFIGSTVRDDIAFGLENNQVKQEDMDSIIDEFSKKVGMENFLDKEPSNLSGGQKQRVAIASVLAMHPKLIIFDESTSMLDPRGKREIKEIINNLRKEDSELTILIITHDLEETVNADRVLVINDGQVVLNDTPNKVYEDKEKMVDIKLDIPFFNKLKEELIKKGLDIKSESLIDMVDELCQ